MNYKENKGGIMEIQRAEYPLPCGNTEHIESFSRSGPSCKNCNGSSKKKHSGGHTYMCVREQNMAKGAIVGNGTRQLVHPVRVNSSDYCPRHEWEVVEE